MKGKIYKTVSHSITHNEQTARQECRCSNNASLQTVPYGSMAQGVDARLFSQPIIQRTIDKDFKTKLTDLQSLNTALAKLNPPVANIGLMNFPDAVGATTSMLDTVIGSDNNGLYDSMTQGDVIDYYNDALIGSVDSALDALPYTLSIATGKGAVEAFINGSKFVGSGKGCAEPQLLMTYATDKSNKKQRRVSLSWSQNTLPCENCHDLLKESSLAYGNHYTVKIEDNLGKPYGDVHDMPDNADTTMTYSGGHVTYARNH